MQFFLLEFKHSFSTMWWTQSLNPWLASLKVPCYPLSFGPSSTSKQWNGSMFPLPSITSLWLTVAVLSSISSLETTAGIYKKEDHPTVAQILIAIISSLSTDILDPSWSAYLFESQSWYYSLSMPLRGNWMIATITFCWLRSRSHRSSSVHKPVARVWMDIPLENGTSWSCILVINICHGGQSVSKWGEIQADNR